ncbi:MAG: hypothetical protein H7Z41_12565 [Cytophagales bacterium]|nr:hypothetical protein [Armatimonadota bacterium]
MTYSLPSVPTGPTRVKVFKGSIDYVEMIINRWAEESAARVLNASLTYDTNAMASGSVFVVIVYEPGRGEATDGGR